MCGIVGYVGNYKGGKLLDFIEWYKNGQKSSGETFKDDKEIFSKRWNKD